MSRRRYVYIELTEQQANALASLAEMTVERAGVTFGEWAECNPQSVPALERARERIEFGLTDAAIATRTRAKGEP